MIDLYNAATNQLLGTITDADLKVLVDALEEESAQDQDYYIDTATITHHRQARRVHPPFQMLTPGEGPEYQRARLGFHI